MKIEDIIFKLKILCDAIPCIESDNDIEQMIEYLESRKEFLEETE